MGADTRPTGPSSTWSASRPESGGFVFAGKTPKGTARPQPPSRPMPRRSRPSLRIRSSAGRRPALVGDLRVSTVVGATGGVTSASPCAATALGSVWAVLGETGDEGVGAGPHAPKAAPTKARVKLIISTMLERQSSQHSRKWSTPNTRIIVHVGADDSPTIGGLFLGPFHSSCRGSSSIRYLSGTLSFKKASA